MEGRIRSGAIVFGIFGLLFAMSAVAHAQDIGDISSLVQARLAGLQDRFSQQDQALYARLNIAGRFGVEFMPHAAVCDTSIAGAVHCDSRFITAQLRPDRSRSGGSNAVPPPPASAYGPSQFLTAYGLSGLSNASKPPVIAIVDAYDDPNIASDLAAYSSAFGIPSLPTCSGAIANSSSPCFQKVNQNGSTSSHPSSNAGWALEISLDVEVAHATCQNCSIALVEANSSNYSDLMAAEDRAVALGANVVSNSWGSSEFSGENSYDSHFQHPGVAFTFSAGDSGYGVEYPAASPYVTSVGGTSLFLNADSSYNSELVWSGTGSGCSAFETKPVWQADGGCSHRTVVDVSADADPNTGAAVYDTVRYAGQSGWFQVGGTSLASPLIAAIYAQSGVEAGTQENSVPYAQGSAADLHDVVSGSNGSCGGSYLCTAMAGYDGPTGLGTPLGTAAFGGTAAPPPPPPSPILVSGITVSDAGSGTVVSGASDQMTATILPANATNPAVAWSVTNGTGSASINSSGLLSAGNAGSVTVIASAQDGSGVSGSETITITPAPAQSFSLTASPTSLTILRGRRGNDTITVVPSGGFSGAVTLSVSGLPSGVGASFSRNPTSSSSTLTLSANRRASTGTYQLTIHGVSGSLSSSVALSLTVR